MAAGGFMLPNQLSSDAGQAVFLCQQQFWHALQRKDAELFAQVLADDFVCRSPGQADQGRIAFIATITSIPLTITNVVGEDLAIYKLHDVAVLTGTQVAYVRLPNGDEMQERLALTNVFRQTAGQWQMVLAHPVSLLD
jgi:ketosteroid isomerase-like protein